MLQRLATKPQNVKKITEMTLPESRDREEEEEIVGLVLEDFDNAIENADFKINIKEKPKKRGNLKKNSEKSRSAEKVLNLSKRLMQDSLL